MILYFVKLISKDGGEEFYKVGVSSSCIKKRFSYGQKNVAESNSLSLREKLEMRLKGQKYIPDIPYRVVEIHTVSYQLEGDALIAESELLEAVKGHQYWPKHPFSGQTECFVGGDIESTIIEYMDWDSKDRENKAPSLLEYKLASSRVQLEYSDPIEKHKAILKKCREL